MEDGSVPVWFSGTPRLGSADELYQCCVRMIFSSPEGFAGDTNWQDSGLTRELTCMVKSFSPVRDAV